MSRAQFRVRTHTHTQSATRKNIRANGVAALFFASFCSRPSRFGLRSPKSGRHSVSCCLCLLALVRGLVIRKDERRLRARWTNPVRRMCVQIFGLVRGCLGEEVCCSIGLKGLY